MAGRHILAFMTSLGDAGIVYTPGGNYNPGHICLPTN